MNGIIDFANKFFKPILDMGAPIIMLIVLTLLALLFGVKFSKALEGGIKLAIALTGIGAIIGMLNGAFSASLAKFVENTGIQLTITDVGWAPLATITWGSAWTLYFLLVMLIVNIVMLLIKKTDTLDVDIFDIWHLSITGLLIKWYADKNGVSAGVSLFVATLAVVLVGVMKIINSDLMKPTFDDLLNAPSSSPMTSTHMNYMMNPIIMVLDKIFDKFIYITSHLATKAFYPPLCLRLGGLPSNNGFFKVTLTNGLTFNLILIKGNVPGAKKSLITIKSAVKAGK